MIAIQTATAPLMPFLAWIASVISRDTLLNIDHLTRRLRALRLKSLLRQNRRRETPPTANLTAPPLSAPSLSAPCCAKQKSEPGGDRKRRIGTFLDRFVDSFDKIVGNFAYCSGCGVGRLAAGIARSRDGITEIGARTLPRRTAFVGEDVADLIGEPAEIVAQRLQIPCNIAGRLGRGFFDVARALADVAHSVGCALAQIL